MKLSDTHMMALRILEHEGSHCIGPLDDMGKIGAAFVFCELQTAGLVISTIGDNGPTHRLTPSGRAALEASRTSEETE